MVAEVDIKKSVIIADINAGDTMSIVRELREHGLVQGTDFDFCYMPRSGEWQVIPSYAEFFFYDEKYATFFSLKYL